MKSIEQQSDLPKRSCLMACRDIKRRLEKVGIEAEKVKPGINMGAYFTVRKEIIQFLVFEIMRLSVSIIRCRNQHKKLRYLIADAGIFIK